MGRRKGEPEKAPNHERWLITYSDLITLLMIFFVLMYTISNVNAKKFAQLSSSMSEALLGEKSGSFVGEAPGPMLVDTGQTAAGAKTEAASMEGALKELEKYIKEKGLEGKVEVGQEERGLVISLKEALLFRIGSADLTPEARNVVGDVGQVLAKMPNNIRIEGHTCNLPINTSRYPSNWELSTARATNVVRYLVTQVGLKPEMLSATGYGEFRPIVPNTSEQNRVKNRRVDIVVLKSLLNIAEPGKDNQVIIVE
ncbi:OmpA/MotB family protein [Phosphitispora fastidiosa]|uniref:OmpA/MotB family protein n=1 Tax=Phosphitispora fastidiosa TaxID=2837202 RepID=UPI001E5BF8C6|nr:flagellar motor protein MotB [Phosphitispora fastidiosa]MBU7006367.1 chemotaxis protein MotB [Phosphitispora fastidiosa]